MGIRPHQVQTSDHGPIYIVLTYMLKQKRVTGVSDFLVLLKKTYKEIQENVKAYDYHASKWQSYRGL